MHSMIIFMARIQVFDGKIGGKDYTDRLLDDPHENF
jgi:hypothetical protein